MTSEDILNKIKRARTELREPQYVIISVELAEVIAPNWVGGHIGRIGGVPVMVCDDCEEIIIGYVL